MRPRPAGALLRSPEIATLAEAGGLALQPIGATEQHGPHLPLTTDAILAEALAARTAHALAERIAAGDTAAPPVWLLPVLAYGKSPEHTGFPGTITLSSTTLLAVCLDLARSVAVSGLRTLVFVNAHGGNPELLQLVARDIREATGLLAVTVHAPALPLPDELVRRMPRPDLDVHAGFAETSAMLAVRPESVDLTAAVPDGIERADALARGSASSVVGLFGSVPLPWRSDDLSASGTIGDPTGASVEWGEAALAAWTDGLADAVTEIARLRGELS